MAVEGNVPLVEMLRELAASYFKHAGKDTKNRIKGAMLQRVSPELELDSVPVCMSATRIQKYGALEW